MIDVLFDPDCIFNIDETAFFLCPNTGKMLGIKGQTNVYEVHSVNKKENLIVFCNVNTVRKVLYILA